ncbi:hypothetical protein BN975_02139 [Mycolicibacterium farcinogenes]|nr:hypothetical protein BN975_02139 [Mycolicibacterium farcinogenes]
MPCTGGAVSICAAANFRTVRVLPPAETVVASDRSTCTRQNPDQHGGNGFSATNGMEPVTRSESGVPGNSSHTFAAGSGKPRGINSQSSPKANSGSLSSTTMRGNCRCSRPASATDADRTGLTMATSVWGAGSVEPGHSDSVATCCVSSSSATTQTALPSGASPTGGSLRSNPCPYGSSTNRGRTSWRIAAGCPPLLGSSIPRRSCSSCATSQKRCGSKTSSNGEPEATASSSSKDRSATSTANSSP